MPVKRLVYWLLLLAAAFLAPWWFSFLLLIGGALYFDHFYEAVPAGLVFDLLYGLPTTSFLGPLMVTNLALVSIFILTEAKRLMVFPRT